MHDPVPIPPRLPPPPRDPLEDVLVAERLAGQTIAQIARTHGLTPDRVKRLLAFNGVTGPRPTKAQVKVPKRRPVRLAPTPAAARWSDDDLAWWLAVYLQRFRAGRVRGGETQGAYDAWARTDPRVPPGQLLLTRYGSWKRAKAAAETQGL